MKEYDPLTPEEVNDAAKEFFPLFECQSNEGKSTRMIFLW